MACFLFQMEIYVLFCEARNVCGVEEKFDNNYSQLLDLFVFRHYATTKITVEVK